MLTTEDNDLLTRTGPGTPMGAFMRLHWIPFARSQDLPASGERPLRIKLLGEKLVAFRDGQGKVGVLHELCPHRRASFAYGRCEPEGVRCMYHGWKFDVTGQCLDTPTEPEDSQISRRLRHPAYMVRERNGVLWVYMGDQQTGAETPLPDMEFNLVPADQTFISLRVQHCNWLQALEGSLDSAHAPLLHGRIDGHKHTGHFGIGNRPRFEVQDKEYGVMVGAKRPYSEPGTVHWRINQFLMPFYTLVPPMEADPVINGQAWVPMDDEHTIVFMFAYHPSEPFPPSSLGLYRDGRRDGTDSGFMTARWRLPHQAGKPYPDFWPALNVDNDYGYDAERQRTRYFSGIPGIWPQDSAAQESMGAVVDRRFEHLGTTDAGIARMRRCLLRSVRAFQQEKETPATARHAAAYRVRPVGLVSAEPNASMEDATGAFASRFQKDYGYAPV